MNHDLKMLVTEQANRKTTHIDQCTTAELLELINNEDRLVPDAVRAELPNIALAVDKIVERFKAGGRLFYVGAGTSGRIGILDASECPPTFCTDPSMVQAIIAGGAEAIQRAIEGSEDDYGAGAQAISDYEMTAQDAMVGITASGRTPFVLGAIAQANQAGLLTIGLSNNEGSQLSQMAQIAITPQVGPEVIQGSTRLKAGTSQKLVLNMLSTGAMIRLGKVYNNLMIELQPSNDKLADRAKRIIATAAGIEQGQAGQLYHQAGENTKVAIVMAKLGCDLETAQAFIAQHKGVISDVLP